MYVRQNVAINMCISYKAYPTRPVLVNVTKPSLKVITVPLSIFFMDRNDMKKGMKL